MDLAKGHLEEFGCALLVRMTGWVSDQVLLTGYEDAGFGSTIVQVEPRVCPADSIDSNIDRFGCIGAFGYTTDDCRGWIAFLPQCRNAGVGLLGWYPRE